MIYYIFGPQASGKTTIANRLREHYSNSTDSTHIEILDNFSNENIPVHIQQLIIVSEITGARTIILSQEYPSDWILFFNPKVFQTLS